MIGTLGGAHAAPGRVGEHQRGAGLDLSQAEKILYLQNNIIKKMQNLNHMKELEYINLALNNISKIEGLQSCEFLKKLDLTANFVDVDELEASIDHLVPRDRLRELYLMGNPAEAEWPDFKSFVIAKLPQLASLDGTEITKGMQIVARQKLPSMEKNLRQLAIVKKREKERKAREKAEGLAPTRKKKESRVVELDEDDNEIVVEDVSEDEDEAEELTENTPEVREEIYRELAAQKKEKEDRDNENKPRERDYEKEQKEAIEAVRTKEEEEKGEVKQKNEGGWDFKWDEDSKPGYLILDIPLPRHLTALDR